MRVLWLLVIVGLAGTSRAGDFWLQPERGVAVLGATVNLRGVSITDATGTSQELQSKDLAQCRAFLAGEPIFLLTEVEAGIESGFSIHVPRAGVATIAMELAPRFHDVATDQVERYLRALHATDELRDVWAALPGPRRWRERKTQVTKVFIRVGEPSAGDLDWKKPLGLPIEMIAQRDPTMLKPGDEFSVQVLRPDGPLAGCVVEFVSLNEEHEHVTITNREGVAAAPLQSAGWWRLRATELRQSADPECTWDSAVTTMVVEVR